MSRSKSVVCFLVLAMTALISMLHPPSAGAQDCVSEVDAHATYLRGVDWYCTNGGAACAQCAAVYSGGYTVCTSDAGGFHLCISYQNP